MLRVPNRLLSFCVLCVPLLLDILLLLSEQTNRDYYILGVLAHNLFDFFLEEDFHFVEGNLFEILFLLLDSLENFLPNFGNLFDSLCLLCLLCLLGNLFFQNLFLSGDNLVSPLDKDEKEGNREELQREVFCPFLLLILQPFRALQRREQGPKDSLWPMHL